MCGIVGVLSSADFEITRNVFERMTDSMASRGPDDVGYWFDSNVGISLGHRRLAIVDLSTAGHQPMVSTCSRYVMVFNGEIYNHACLRKRLDKCGIGIDWHGHSDTEVLLAGIRHWGFESTIKQCIGMFAIAVWDREANVLNLARDRIGEKPIYYGWLGKHFVFASDLSAFKVHPAFSAELNLQAVSLMMRHNYIPAPYSIYQGIHKLTPGACLSVSLSNPNPKPIPYWRVHDVILDGMANPFTGSPEEAVDALETLLMDAVANQMMSDVPLGAFLSGGIDSSTVVALMQAQSARAIQTFSIGFNEEGYNEAIHAKAVAKHLGTDHTELYASPKDALEVIPKLASIYTEPFSDSSAIPTFMVSQLARKHVSVALTGDAGDELFGGYSRYSSINSYWSKISKLPIPLRILASRCIQLLTKEQWSFLLQPVRPILPARFRMQNLGEVAYKIANSLNWRDLNEVYQIAVSHWLPSELLYQSIDEPETAITNRNSVPPILGIHRMMALDTLSYLPDDILCKVDRASMAVSLESRVPFLDHRVIELAWRFPLALKMRNGVSKWPLREVLYRHVPKSLVERPKMGFGVPLDSWLRGPLKDWAENLLDERRLCEQGVFKATPIRKKWAEHLSGKTNAQYLLWDVLMFQAWVDEQKK